jgi:hypothetical protein
MHGTTNLKNWLKCLKMFLEIKPARYKKPGDKKMQLCLQFDSTNKHLILEIFSQNQSYTTYKTG